MSRDQLIDTLWNIFAPAIRQTPEDREFYGEAVDEVVAAALAQEREECAKVAEAQAEIFRSNQYALGQPLSSFNERFACAQIAAAIRARSGI